MEKLEMVEKVIEKCGVSFDEAKQALEACDYDVLEAIITIERAHKSAEPEVSYTIPDADFAYDEIPTVDGTEPKQSKTSEGWTSFCEGVKDFARKGMDTEFVIEHNGKHAMSLPVLLVVLGLFIWGATLWLLVIGLFFGFRYRIESAGILATDLNQTMAKAADVADDIKGHRA